MLIVIHRRRAVNVVKGSSQWVDTTSKPRHGAALAHQVPMVLLAPLPMTARRVRSDEQTMTTTNGHRAKHVHLGLSQ